MCKTFFSLQYPLLCVLFTALGVSESVFRPLVETKKKKLHRAENLPFFLLLVPLASFYIPFF